MRPPPLSLYKGKGGGVDLVSFLEREGTFPPLSPCIVTLHHHDLSPLPFAFFFMKPYSHCLILLSILILLIAHEVPMEGGIPWGGRASGVAAAQGESHGKVVVVVETPRFVGLSLPLATHVTALTRSLSFLGRGIRVGMNVTRWIEQCMMQATRLPSQASPQSHVHVRRLVEMMNSMPEGGLFQALCNTFAAGNTQQAVQEYGLADLYRALTRWLDRLSNFPVNEWVNQQRWTTGG